MQVATIGLDLAKNVFQIHGMTQDDKVAFNRPLRRAQLLRFFSKLEPCLIGMEACSRASLATFANRIVGWKASATQDTQFVLDAFEQAIHARKPAEKLIHHSDRGSQYVSIKYTERLADAGLEPSVGSVGDSYVNALAETTIGLFKTEVINRLGPWKSKVQVEWETLQWVDWFNKESLLEPLGYITTVEAEEKYQQALKADKIAA